MSEPILDVEDLETYNVPKMSDVELRDKMRIAQAWYCVPTGTKVYANPNTVQIESLNVADSVLSGAGMNQKITRIFERKYEGELVCIKPWLLEEVRLTPNHEILLYQRDKRWEKVKSFGKGKRPEFIESIKAKPGDWVVVPLPPEKDSLKSFLMSSYATCPYELNNGKIRARANYTTGAISDRLEVTEELFELFGWYLAEGSIDETSIRFSLGTEEEADRIIALIISEWNPKKLRIKTGWRVSIHNRLITSMFFELFKTGSYEKQIGEIIFSAENKYLEALLKGYISGDGHVYKNKEWSSAVTVSPGIMDGIRFLCLRLGFLPSIGKYKCSGGVINGRKIIAQHDQYLIHMPKSLRMPTYANYKRKDNTLLVPIRDTHCEMYEGDVCNLSTVDERYCLPFVVHNCSKKGGKNVKFSYKAILEFLEKIIKELEKRGKTEFHPEKMKPCSREAFLKVAPKESYENPKLWGIYLVEPHGELIWKGEKSLVVKSVNYRRMEGEPMYLISGKKCYGTIEFKKGKEIKSLKEFNELRPKHKITETERRKWSSSSMLNGWCDAPYWTWEIGKFEKYEKPKTVEIPRGIQNFISPKNVEFK